MPEIRNKQCNIDACPLKQRATVLRILFCMSSGDKLPGDCPKVAEVESQITLGGMKNSPFMAEVEKKNTAVECIINQNS